MKPLFALLICLVCTAVQARHPYSSICTIVTKNCQGSGTLVAVKGQVGLVLTCRHVAQREGDVVLCRWLQEDTAGVVVRVLAGNGYESDQAVIMCVRPRNTFPVRVGRFDLMGGPWVSAGYRDGVLYQQTHRYATEKDGLVKLTGPFIKGQSGGATFDRHGRLVAIVVASDFKVIGYSTNGPRLRAMLKQFGKSDF